MSVLRMKRRAPCLLLLFSWCLFSGCGSSFREAATDGGDASTDRSDLDGVAGDSSLGDSMASKEGGAGRFSCGSAGYCEDNIQFCVVGSGCFSLGAACEDMEDPCSCGRAKASAATGLVCTVVPDTPKGDCTLTCKPAAEDGGPRDAAPKDTGGKESEPKDTGLCMPIAEKLTCPGTSKTGSVPENYCVDDTVTSTSSVGTTPMACQCYPSTYTCSCIEGTVDKPCGVLSLTGCSIVDGAVVITCGT
jgi:hypothetical protein